MIKARDMSAAEVCEILGIHKQTLEKYQRTEKLMPDYRFSDGTRMYTADSLELFMRRWQSDLMTQVEIAELFEVTEDAVVYNFRRKRRISADAKFGKFDTYSDSKILMVARSEGWVSDFNQVQVADLYLGSMKIEATGTWLVFKRANMVIDVLVDDIKNPDEARRILEENVSEIRYSFQMLSQANPQKE